MMLRVKPQTSATIYKYGLSYDFEFIEKKGIIKALIGASFYEQPSKTNQYKIFFGLKLDL